MSRRIDSFSAALAIVTILTIAWASPGLAGPRERAKRIHDRLVGVPPSLGVLGDMQTAVEEGRAVDAALTAMENPVFYSRALKNFVTPWTNVDQTVFGELNDYTGTVIGVVRDDRPFTDVLTADVVYVGAPGVVPSGYSHTDNDHYRELEEARIDLGDSTLFVGVPQSTLPNSQLSSSEAAGVITTRAAGEAFFSAGTNRRMWRFLSMNYLCRDMEDLKDITRAADRVRQDVTRSPGGDSSIFLNSCVGCHSGMDPMAQAFAYFEWDEATGRVVHTAGQVQPKYLINATTFPGGYITEGNRWDNYWRGGPNASLGWSTGTPGGGWGAQSLGREVAESDAFAQCQVEKVFKHVCFREPNVDDTLDMERITGVFQTDFSLKQVFAEVAAYCLGD